MTENFKQRVFDTGGQGFNDLALDIFYYQSKNNPVYAQFLRLIDIRPEKILEADQIPALPIEFFKTHEVICPGAHQPGLVFTSSSTGGNGSSRHYVQDIALYQQSFTRGFESRFGPVDEYTFRFLLPSYLERQGSSLVYMAEHLLQLSGKGGFYLSEFEKLAADLKSDQQAGRKVILLGVSFALMDFAAGFPMDLSGVTVMETGGMKGRREEITREELHRFLEKQFQIGGIASEYGMTELLSQAYSLEKGVFHCPPWMKVDVVSTTDPFSREKPGRTGRIKVTDLANLESCCFLLTSDLGRLHAGGSFEVLGRFDDSEVRGCNLLYG